MANHAVLSQAQNECRVCNVDMASAPFPAITDGWILSAAQTTSGTSDTIVGVGNYTSAQVEVNVTASSGTSPTMTVYVQQLLPDKTNWMDIGATAQFTGGAGKYTLNLASGGDSNQVPTDGSLSAGSTVTTPFTESWRVKYTIGGTNPSFTFSVSASFVQ